MLAIHAAASPSEWVRCWAGVLAPGCNVLDLACGRGRHATLLASLGHSVLAVDRDAQALAEVPRSNAVTTLTLDLEAGDWPLPGRRFGGIVATNYLHRPLFPALIGALADDGVLIYETFAAGNERFGKPSNPAFLLDPGELLEVVRGRLRVIAFEDVTVEQPKPAVIQRICACTEAAVFRLSLR